MQILCPSCSAVYDTNEYPNSFEINCACGYSILVPQVMGDGEEQNPSQKNAPNFDAAVPSALDAEDDGLLIRPEGLMAMNPDKRDHFQAGEGVLGMTPPEDLPAGMVYDPFELPEARAPSRMQAKDSSSSDELDLGNADVFLDDSSSDSSVKTSGQESSAPLQTALPPSGVKKAAPAVLSKAQNLVSRSQLASMGNFLGASFRLQIQDVAPADIDRLLIRIQKILNDRPWLQSEVKKRQIAFEKLKTDFEIDGVPEILALEIYLAAFEMGGHCTFTLST